MGCDIHLYLEEHTPNGWEGIWGSPLFYSDWMLAKYPAFESWDTTDKAALALRGTRNRNYDLFGLLSGVRAPNMLSSMEPGIPECLMEDGWPTDCSALARIEQTCDDYHSFGWATLSTLDAYAQTLRPLSSARIASYCKQALGDDPSVWKDTHEGMVYQRKAYLNWLRTVHASVTHLVGKKPLLGSYVNQLPDEDQPGSYIPYGDTSAHSVLQAKTIWNDLRNTRKKKADITPHIRVLVCYDN